MADLKIATGLTLPLDAVTQKFAILAVSGRGKTYTASVMVEEMVGAGLPVCVVDPTGAWWGLRSSVDGKKAGLGVVILGGKHADVPLEPTAGRLIADMLVERPFPCVLDVSGFETKADEIRFMTDFLTRLYRKNSEPLHLVIDEADEFAPQQSFPEGKRLLGAMEQIVRRGRLKGLGCTLISQRPAVLNKNVLSQIETLILLGITGANDLKAIDDWVGKHADSEEARSIKGTLPGLPIGTAWVWSPAWLGITKKVSIRKRRTFDSSATPKVGEVREVRTMAPVDLLALRGQMAATIEKVEAEDPKHLRFQIHTLRKEIEGCHREIDRLVNEKPEPVMEQVPVSVLDDDDRMVLTEVAQTLDKILSVQGAGSLLTTPPAPASAALSASPAQRQRALATPEKTPYRPPEPKVAAPASNGAGTMSKVQRMVLHTLAQHGTLSMVQIAKITGYSSTSGGFKNGLSSLRTLNWIEGGGSAMTITPLGAEALGSWQALPKGDALFVWWVEEAPPINKAEATIMKVLRDHYPEFVDNATLADLTGYSPTSGGFKNAMSSLRTLGIAKGSGGLALSEKLVG